MVASPYITKISVLRTILLSPVIVRCMEKNADITKARYNEYRLPLPWQFVISGAPLHLISKVNA